MQRPLLITLPIEIKTYDIDFVNIVHNMVYIRWLEDMRLHLLADIYTMADMLADGVSPVLTRTEIDYRLPLRFGDKPIGTMWVSKLSRIKWTIEAKISVGEQQHAAAKQFGYFANLKTLRPVRIPSILQEKWAMEII
ncbi:MAG: acyl-CoA thioesterase [Anaerolineales bacterium]|nr:acyl-CoA thioesterase [Anaerolineales bacterium]